MKNILLILLFICHSSIYAANDTNDILAKELTTLFRSAQKVVSDNQALINNEKIGNKGLTGSKVLKDAKENYYKATGRQIDMSTNTKAKQVMFNAIVTIMDDNQALINQKGKGFKNFLPAIFARKVASEFTKNMSGEMSIKLTAPKNYIRNPSNMPDAWEDNIIENLFKSPNYPSGQSFSEVIIDKKNHENFRYILPQYYKLSCLTCHGKPKGEIDITGDKKEGGELNELGGAISLTIYDIK